MIRVKCFLRLVVLLVLPGGVYDAEAQLSPQLKDHIQDRMVIEDIPGISISLIDEYGESTFHSFGHTSLEKTKQVDEHTLYEIGSITKTFTGTLFVLLMDEYGFDFETPVNTLLGDDELQLPDTNGQAITLKQMMTHTSGLPRLPGNMSPADDNDPYKDYTIKQLIEYVNQVQPERAPGEGFEYSNLAYMVLGYTAEVLTGNTYDNLIREYITQPLEMNETFREVPAHLVSYKALGSIFGQPAADWNMDEIRGLGEIRSSTHDMALYMHAQLGTLGIPDLDTAHQFLYEMDESRHMGFSWFLDTLEDGDELIGHGGGTGGFRTYAVFSKVSGKAAVVFSNSNSDMRDIAMHLVNDSFELRPLPVASEIGKEIIAQLTGMYTNPDLPLFTILEREGSLYGQLEGQPPLPLEHMEEYRFKNVTVGAEMEFSDLGEGVMNQLTLKQGGAEMIFMRTQTAPEGPVLIEMSAAELEEYAGEYSSQMGLSYTISAAEGTLSARLTGQPAATVYPQGDDRFFYKVVVASMQFERNSSGELTALVLNQGGQQIKFEKQ